MSAQQPVTLLGEMFGVRIAERHDAGPLITLLVEDDGFWHDKMSFDIAWLPDLVRVLRQAASLHSVDLDGSPTDPAAPVEPGGE